MIDKKVFELILSKLNDETINTQGVVFKGNFVFVRMNDTQTLASPSTYNAWDLKNSTYIGVAEAVSQPTDFVEKNNRTGWIKSYVFQFRADMKDKALEALQEVYLYFKSNNVQSVVDDVTYKLVFKVNRPKFEGNQQQSGTISVTYSMDFFFETIETGYYGNEATHQMALDGGTLQTLIIDQVSVSSATAFNPTNVLTAEANAGNEPLSRGVSFNFIVYYDSTTLLETIYKQIEGKHTREQVYDYSKVFDGITHTYELYISGGSVVYKNGQIIQLNFNAVEV